MGEITIDLIKSFFSAFYSDGYRQRINTDIITFNTILQEIGFELLTSAEDTDRLANSILDKYKKKLRNFKEADSENIIFKCLRFILYTSHAIINPYEFYSTFIDIPYSQLKIVFDRIPKIHRLSDNSRQTQISDADFSNNLYGMDTFFEDEDRDALIYGIKLIRFLPFFAFNTYVIGGGNYHNQFLTVLNNIKSIIPVINSFKSSHVFYGQVGDFILDELNYLINEFVPQMNSPLKVNNKSIHLLTNLIKRSFVESLSA
jgi:hypothetical protein